MKKGLLIVGALVLLCTLVSAAFAGGLAVARLRGGRASQQPPAATLPAETAALPVDIEMPDVAPTATPVPTPVPQETLPDPGESSSDLRSPAETFDYELLQTVLELLEEQYYGDIPDGKELAYGAVRGMLTALGDPYTSFIDPEITAIINEDATGEFEGIGALVNMREDGYLEIASLIPGQPAEAAGVRAGDVVLAVGDQSLVGLGLYEAIGYIRGPAGTDAVLEIARAGETEPIVITVTRARIEMPIVESRMLEDDIAYLRLTEFDATAADRVESALAGLLQDEPKALIFDLRDNPGGWLNQAIGVADVFLDQGLVATQRDTQGGEQRFTSSTGDAGEAIPLVVLVNGGSASASEIVAGALQDRGRAILMGTQTLGKGSVQLPNNLDDGSQLRITIARWFTPNEQDLHNNGLAPDVEAPYPADTPVGEDPQLQQAVDYLIENGYEVR
ncbi:MAG: S41 family peptidase [Anaerolineae bacterium]|nr:S41 family peptidase [Anaerolineae bacterium]